MNHAEQHEYLCSILAKLVDSDLTSEELRDMSVMGCGIEINDWYGTPDDQAEAAEIIEWRHKEAA